jgi:16S rRNA (cytosine1402-N4)-methyltransferase
LLWGNFSHLYHILKKAKINSVDGILADFGTSQYQIANMPGLSVYKDSYLDMRMSKAHHKITAYEFINKASQRDLEEIFFTLGEERYSKQIVKAILEHRVIKKIATTYELVEVIKSAVPLSYRKGKIHPATRVFQALRIYVNDELGNIKTFLNAAEKTLNIDGRLVCISFHSLEDRLVKQYFKDNPCRYEKGFEILTKRVVTATDEELKINPSSRSAKLRAAKMCKNENY